MNMISVTVEYNKELSQKEILERKILLSSSPQTLRIILTNRCNIDCIMCDIATQRKNQTIPQGALSKIESILPYVERIDWQGGEVFMVPYFKSFLELIIKRHGHIKHTIQTNGLFLNDEWAELIAANNITLLISVNSTKKDVYEYIHRGANFDILQQNLSRLHEKKIKHASNARTSLCACIMKSNFKEVGAFVDFARTYGFTHISLGFLHGEQVPDEHIFFPHDEQALEYLKTAIPAARQACIEASIQFDCYFESVLGEHPEEKNEQKSDHKSDQKEPEIVSPAIRCDMPWKSLTIDAIRGGMIYPECLCVRPVGNIITDNIDEIWNGEKIQTYRKAILDGDMNVCSNKCFRVINE